MTQTRRNAALGIRGGVHHTTATAKHRAVRHVVLEYLVGFIGIEHTERTAGDMDKGASTIQSEGGIGCAGASLTVSDVVTLTDRA